MNKFLAYTIIAILLGTVTMITPLGMLEQNNNIPTRFEDTITDQENPANDIEPNVPEYDGSEMLSAPEVPKKPIEELSYEDKEPEEPQVIEETSLEPQIGDSNLILTDATSGLSLIGLMIIPSFLVALSVFVYLKKRTK
jgi:hypothetical protein